MKREENICFPPNNLSLHNAILLKFIWYLTINKVKVGFDKGGYASILSEIMVPDRLEKLHFFISAQ